MPLLRSARTRYNYGAAQANKPDAVRIMDWNIQQPNRECLACEKQFEEGELCFSALFDSGESFERKDYCTACWEGASAEKQAFSFWKTHVPTKEEERKLLVDNDVLLDFFVRLSEEEGEQPDHKTKFRYILALVLMRKRSLRFVDIERDNGAEYLILRYPNEDREFKVLDPGLTEEEADTVKDDLSQILNTDV